MIKAVFLKCLIFLGWSSAQSMKNLGPISTFIQFAHTFTNMMRWYTKDVISVYFVIKAKSCEIKLRENYISIPLRKWGVLRVFNCCDRWLGSRAKVNYLSIYIFQKVICQESYSGWEIFTDNETIKNEQPWARVLKVQHFIFECAELSAVLV